MAQFPRLTDGRWYVYALSDPRDGAVRYVGISTDVVRRHKEHLRTSSLSCGNHRERWLFSLKRDGFTPAFEVLEVTADWRESERKWIAEFKRLGCNLVNGTEGGDCVPEKFNSRNEERPYSGRHTPMQKVLILLDNGVQTGVTGAAERLQGVREAFARAYAREGKEAAKARINAGLDALWKNRRAT